MMLLALLALLQTWEDVPPNAWVEIDKDATGGVVSMQSKYFGLAAASPADVWVKTDRSRDKTTTIRKTLTRLRANCTAETLQTLSYVNYAASGAVINSSPSYMTSPARPVVPDSIGETILSRACSTK